MFGKSLSDQSHLIAGWVKNPGNFRREPGLVVRMNVSCPSKAAVKELFRRHVKRTRYFQNEFRIPMAKVSGRRLKVAINV